MDDAPVNVPTPDDGAAPAGDAPVGGDDQSFTPPAPAEPTGDTGNEGVMPAGDAPVEGAPAEGDAAPEAPEAPEAPAAPAESAPAEGEAAPADDSTPSDPVSSF